MSTSDFKPFAIGAGHATTSTPDWLSAGPWGPGFSPGILTKESLNKAIRQASLPGAALMQAVSDALGANVVDDGNFAALVTQLKAALSTYAGGDALTATAAASLYAPKGGAGATGTWSISITGTAAGAPWTGITGRPTLLSQFTNDIGLGGGGGTATWESITGKPDAVSYWTNDAGYVPSASLNGLVAGLGYIKTAALAGLAVLASGPTFSGTVKGNGGSKGLGAITTTTTPGTPSGGSDGDFVLVY